MMEVLERFFPEDGVPLVRVQLLFSGELPPASRERLLAIEETQLFAFVRDTLSSRCFPEGVRVSPPPLISVRYHPLSEKEGILRLRAVCELFFCGKRIFIKKSEIQLEAASGRFTEGAHPKKKAREKKTHRRKKGGGRS